MNSPHTPKGLPWNVGSIANGLWEGVLIRDILKEFGYEENNSNGLHLIVEGMDKDFQGTNYSISIPLEYAYKTEALLAFGYNEGEIPLEHGFPLRLIVPGVVGVRNVKWIKSIKISDKESTGAFQKRDYKIIPQNENVDKVDLDKLPALMEHVLNSAIACPIDGDVFKSGENLNVKGWAIGNFGSKIELVELSFDEGKTWNKIDKLRFNESKNGRVYGWTLWEFLADTNDLKGETSIWVRAKDSKGNNQPLNSEDIWNFRGLMNNSIHKIRVNII